MCLGGFETNDKWIDDAVFVKYSPADSTHISLICVCDNVRLGRVGIVIVFSGAGVGIVIVFSREPRNGQLVKPPCLYPDAVELD